MRFTERLAEIGARPSIGTVADSYDNALAETTNGLYKTECVYGPDTAGWDDVDELELATLSWVHWFNENRVHGHCGDVPPAEYEAAFYAAQRTTPTGGGIQQNEPPSDPGQFKGHDEMVAATIRTIFAQPGQTEVRAHVDFVADMLAKQFPPSRRCSWTPRPT